MVERLQKIIAESGYCSRRKAENLIEKGLVAVNGHPAVIGDKADAQKDLITIGGERLLSEKKKTFRYLMLYKPRGYVSTMSDERGRRCVAELVQDVGTRVFPVGRLDVNSEGLLLFTNDGRFANDMMHPSRHVTKTYRVTVRPDLTEEQAAQLEAGVVIDGRMTAPARVLILEKQPGRVVAEMIIHEGRNRQIRKMLEAVGVETARLKRAAIGPLKLGMLKPGAWRDLTADEVRALKNAVKKPAAR